MNNAEFKEWLKYHDKSFVGVLAFVMENNSAEAWEGALVDIELDWARQSTDEMFKDETNKRYFTDHPAVIRAISKRLRFASNEIPDRSDQVRLTCSLCQDSGHLIVFHVKAYRAARLVIEGAKKSIMNQARNFGRMSVSCPECDLGRSRKARPFDSYTMCRVDFNLDIDGQIDQLIEFVTSGLTKVENHGNYHAELA